MVCPASALSLRQMDERGSNKERLAPFPATKRIQSAFSRLASRAVGSDKAGCTTQGSDNHSVDRQEMTRCGRIRFKLLSKTAHVRIHRHVGETNYLVIDAIRSAVQNRVGMGEIPVSAGGVASLSIRPGAFIFRRVPFSETPLSNRYVLTRDVIPINGRTSLSHLPRSTKSGNNFMVPGV
jgi:hypothetical protein